MSDNNVNFLTDLFLGMSADDRTSVLSVRQIGLLFSVCRLPGRSTGVNAEDMGIPKPAVTRAIQALVASSLIERIDDPDDGHKCKLYITKYGEELVKAITAKACAAQDCTPK